MMVPNRIAALRARMGLSQARLAAVLGTSELTVWRWENGQARPEGAAATLLEVLEQRTRLLPKRQVQQAVESVNSGTVAVAALIALLVVLFAGKK